MSKMVVECGGGQPGRQLDSRLGRDIGSHTVASEASEGEHFIHSRPGKQSRLEPDSTDSRQPLLLAGRANLAIHTDRSDCVTFGAANP